MADKIDSFKKLKNTVLIPVHNDSGIIPPYPLCGKREILCGPHLENKETRERKFIRTSGFFFDIEEVISQLNEEDQNLDLILLVLQSTSLCRRYISPNETS